MQLVYQPQESADATYSMHPKKKKMNTLFDSLSHEKLKILGWE